MRWIKTIYDFFRLWIKWVISDAKEAWQDAKTINDPTFIKDMEDLDEIFDVNQDHLGIRVERKKHEPL